jgi:hypothetical protein
MLTYTFKLGKDIAFKCNAKDEESAWQTFSVRKKLTVEYLKTHYKIEKI